MSEHRMVLVCPPWPGRDRFADVRKVMCGTCKQEVSITAFNLPQLLAQKVEVWCEGCYDKVRDEHPEQVESRGVNLPGSGHFMPFPTGDE